ncbi:hypothetical protein PLICRDRAFT_39971 [Plicaturopsis crispa FD-325 SS-3]|nr:hypothetical protein PLICRDRAFT_39971 [Plicaturopsis crispa FD-325 SS-3]
MDHLECRGRSRGLGTSTHSPPGLSRHDILCGLEENAKWKRLRYRATAPQSGISAVCRVVVSRDVLLVRAFQVKVVHVKALNRTKAFKRVAISCAGWRKMSRCAVVCDMELRPSRESVARIGQCQCATMFLRQASQAKDMHANAHDRTKSPERAATCIRSTGHESKLNGVRVSQTVYMYPKRRRLQHNAAHACYEPGELHASRAITGASDGA